MIPHRPFDPSLLDAIEQNVGEWSGTAYRQVFEGTDVLRANIRGGRWNPPEVEAVSNNITSDMMMGEDLSVPQLVGGAVNWLQCAGMLIPSARDAGDNLVIFVNNMGPTDVIDPVSEEVYSPTDHGGK